MILVTYQHTLRASETTGFTADAVQDGYLTIKRLKRSKKTTHPLVEDPDELFDERNALIDLVKDLLPNQRVFPIHRSTFWRKIRRYAKAAGIPEHKAHPHALKHSLAMQMIGIAGIENVRTYSGHKSMASTGEYLKVSDTEASAAIQRARDRQRDH